MNYQRMAIEEEAPEEVGVVIKYNLSESAISDQTLDSLSITIPPNSSLPTQNTKEAAKSALSSRKLPMALLPRTIFSSLWCLNIAVHRQHFSSWSQGPSCGHSSQLCHEPKNPALYWMRYYLRRSGVRIAIPPGHRPHRRRNSSRHHQTHQHLLPQQSYRHSMHSIRTPVPRIPRQIKGNLPPCRRNILRCWKWQEHG